MIEGPAGIEAAQKVATENAISIMAGLVLMIGGVILLIVFERKRRSGRAQASGRYAALGLAAILAGAILATTLIML